MIEDDNAEDVGVLPPLTPNPLLEVEPDEAPDAGAVRERSRAPRAPRKARKPRRDRPDVAPASKQRVAASQNMSRAVLAKGLERSIQGIAIAVMVIDAEDGAIIARGERALTEALLATADQNPRFKKRLEELLTGGTYMQLAVAVGAIILPITMRHVPVPPQLRPAAAAMQMHAAGDVPDAPPASWGGTDEVLVPGVQYVDEHGPFTVDDAGNVIPGGIGGDFPA